MTDTLSDETWFHERFGSSPTNYLITTAMTQHHFDNWFSNSLPSWREYADEYGLGILCFKSDLVDHDSATYKNGSWQKLLAPAAAKALVPNISRMCLLDSDIVIGPFADDIFEASPTGRFSVVSLIRDLPFPESEVLRRVAFLRHTHYSEKYPLDSFLLGDPFDEFRDLGLAPPENYFCAGLIVLDASHSIQMSDWFHSIGRDQELDAWEQTHLNFWVQRTDPFWLPYEFQAIWKYEMAWKYPFLYGLGEEIYDSELAAKCVRASLWNNHFLHFAGSWFESLAWGTGAHTVGELDGIAHSFSEYRSKPISGAKVGKITPSCL